MKRCSRSFAALLTLACALGIPACGGSRPGQGGTAPAQITNPKKEAELATITLTPEAESRLGIEVVEVVSRTVPLERQVGGELLLPPGRSAPVASPVAGRVEAASGVSLVAGARVRQGQVLLRLTPLAAPARDLHLSYEAEAAAAKARLDAARLQLDRARQLLRDEVGSQRGVEQAEQEFIQAKAADAAARERLTRLDVRPLDADVSVPIASPVNGVLRQVLTAPGQVVAAGAPLFEAVDTRTLWVRVPVYVGELADFAGAQSAAITPLGTSAPVTPRRARRVSGPPTADAASASADLYFALDNPDAAFRPGQRVGVALESATTAQSLVVPASALAYDYNGGAWVYVKTAEHTYTRQRVEVIRTVGTEAMLHRGPQPGARVVSVAVAELFGTEFGSGK
jgi:RND family efflux transporter MFP subunit